MSIILFNQVIDMLDIWIDTKLVYFIDYHSFHRRFYIPSFKSVRSKHSEIPLYLCMYRNKITFGTRDFARLSKDKFVSYQKEWLTEKPHFKQSVRTLRVG